MTIQILDLPPSNPAGFRIHRAGSFFTGADPILGKSTSSTCTTAFGGGSQGALSPLAIGQGRFLEKHSFFVLPPFLGIVVFFFVRPNQEKTERHN